MSVVETVHESSHFTVVDQVCRYPRVDCGSPQQEGEPARFVFTRRGSFAFHVDGRTWFARPGNAVVLQKHVDYRVTHPDHDGHDCCTDVRVDDATLDMMGLGGPGAPPCRDLPHDLDFQKTHVAMLLGMRRDGDALSGEEVLLVALDHLLDMPAASRLRMRRSESVRRVERVEDAIIGHLEDNIGIHELARQAGCSPFHLCRIFRAVTGQSLRQFRLQQRLGVALERLGEGEDDLAALACDLGFSSHSHMTGAFRRTLGASPQALREELRHSNLERLAVRLRDRAASRLN